MPTNSSHAFSPIKKGKTKQKAVEDEVEDVENRNNGL